VVGTVAAKGNCEVMAEIAAIYPAQALSAFLDWPKADLEDLLRLKAAEGSVRRNRARDPEFTALRELCSFVGEQLLATANSGTGARAQTSCRD
jgi:hypothetical protein